MPDKPPIDSLTAAQMLGISPATLRIWRVRGLGPPFIKLGPAKQAPVVYDPDDVRAWIDARRFESTSAYQSIKLGNSRTSPATY